jgi:hypothetical protein
MARRLKPRYVKIYGLTPVNTERGMALSAKDEDNRDIYVLAGPKMLLALAKSLIKMTAHEWFRNAYNADQVRVYGMPAALSHPVQDPTNPTA